MELDDGASVRCDTRPEIGLSTNIIRSSHIASEIEEKIREEGGTAEGRGMKEEEGKKETHTFFCDGPRNRGALHLALGVHDDTRVVLKVEEYTVSPAPGFALADNYCGHGCGEGYVN